jgi:hypothetical protein
MLREVAPIYRAYAAEFNAAFSAQRGDSLATASRQSA